MPIHPKTEAMLRLGDELCALAGHLAAAEARWLCLLAEFDEQEGWGEYGCGSCAHWLSWKLGIDRRTGQEKLRVARALRALPVIRTAFLAGELTYSKVRAVTRFAKPETDEMLAEFAKVATAAHLETLSRGYRHNRPRPEPSPDRPDTFLRYDIDEEDGSIVGTFRLPPAEGMVFLQAVNAERLRHYDETPVEQRPDFDEQAAVALLAMAEKDLTDIDPTGTRFLVVLHTDPPTLAGEDTGRSPHVEDGPDLATDVARRIACDARLNRMVWGPDSEILDHGRSRRTSPPAQRRAVLARDACCRFPGCGRTRRLKIHHIRWWSDDGETDMDNLVALCAEHHRLVHEGGWDLRGNPNEALVFFDPDGRPVDPGSNTTRSVPEVVPLSNVVGDLDITAETAESTWAGERCDYDTAIVNLLAAERRAAEATVQRTQGPVAA